MKPDNDHGSAGCLEQENLEGLDGLFAERLEPFLEDFSRRVNTLILGRISAVKMEYDRAERRFALSQRAFGITILVGVCVALLVGFFDAQHKRAVGSPHQRH